MPAVRTSDRWYDTTTRAAKLTGQLLAFARRQALKPEVFDVNRSASAIGDMIGTLTGARIRIELDLSEEPCAVDADPSQFDTALVNMAVNARDAMAGEGTLRIAVRRTSSVPARRAHPALDGDFVEVSISDNGSGIAPADLDRIFEPFFTTKGVSQGTGLGLSQVFGFAKQSGGEIAVESEVGRGTTFRLYMPRVGQGAPADEDAGPEVDTSGQGISVLVVEDNAEVGSFAVQTLGELGYLPTLVHDAEAALAVLAREAPSFDVMFSDVVMPGMGGIELGRILGDAHPKLPVVLTSGYSHILAEEGPQGFELLQKPYSLEELSRVLSKAVQRPRRTER